MTSPANFGKRYMLLWVFIELALVSGAAFTNSNSNIIFEGRITPKTVNQFIKKHQPVIKSIDTLVINSEGGDVEAAIRFAYWIHKYQLHIHVKGVCLSSCANYIFPASRKKIVAKGSLVAWHGNVFHFKNIVLKNKQLIQAKRRMEKTKESYTKAFNFVTKPLNRLIKLENDFFAHINVDSRLCWFGKVRPYYAPSFYFMSASDMRKFGITQISLPKNYHQQDRATKIKYNLRYIDVNSNYASLIIVVLFVISTLTFVFVYIKIKKSK